MRKDRKNEQRNSKKPEEANKGKSGYHVRVPKLSTRRWLEGKVSDDEPSVPAVIKGIIERKRQEEGS